MLSVPHYKHARPMGARTSQEFGWIEPNPTRVALLVDVALLAHEIVAILGLAYRGACSQQKYWNGSSQRWFPDSMMTPILEQPT